MLPDKSCGQAVSRLSESPVEGEQSSQAPVTSLFHNAGEGQMSSCVQYLHGTPKELTQTFAHQGPRILQRNNCLEESLKGAIEGEGKQCVILASEWMVMKYWV